MPASNKPDGGVGKWRRAIDKVLGTIFKAFMLVLSLPYCRVYSQTTHALAKAILESADEPEVLRERLVCWSRSKTDQARYVQVAAAVFLAVSTSCLTSAVFAARHWTGPAFFSSSIVLAMASVFSGAQQTLVLPSSEEIKSFTPRQMRKARLSLAVSQRRHDEVSDFALFAWQVPIMMLSYSVFAFLVGLASAILSPLVEHPHWGNEAKTALVFLVFSVAALASWIFPFYRVHGFDNAHDISEAEESASGGGEKWSRPQSSVIEGGASHVIDVHPDLSPDGTKKKPTESTDEMV